MLRWHSSQLPVCIIYSNFAYRRRLQSSRNSIFIDDLSLTLKMEFIFFDSMFYLYDSIVIPPISFWPPRITFDEAQKRVEPKERTAGHATLPNSDSLRWERRNSVMLLSRITCSNNRRSFPPPLISVAASGRQNAMAGELTGSLENDFHIIQSSIAMDCLILSTGVS